MAVPIEKKKKTKWYVTLKPLKHVSKFVYGPYFRPKRDFILPFFRHEVVVSLRGKKKMPNSVCWFKRAQTSPYFRPERFKSSPNFSPKRVQTHTLWRYAYRHLYSLTFLSNSRQPELVFFSFLDGGFAQMWGQIVSIVVKTHRNTDLVALKGLCHGSPVHFVQFCQLLALNRYGTYM